MTEKTRRRLFALLRTVVCVGALAWVLNGVSLRDYVELTDGQILPLVGETETTVTVEQDGLEVLLPRDQVALNDDGSPRITYGLITALKQSSGRVLLLCLLVFTPVLFIQSLRFVWMLRAQEIHIRYWESVKLTLAGNFLNFAAPGSTGGDLAKAYWIAQHTDLKTEAVTTVLLDRIVGLTGLLTTVGLVIFTCAHDPKLIGAGYVIAALWLGIVGTSVLLATRRVRAWLDAQRWGSDSTARGTGQADQGAARRGRRSRVVRWVLGQALRAAQATRRLLHHKRLVVGALLATVALQLFAVTDFVLICWAVGMDFSDGKMWDYYAVTSTGVIIALFPVSFQGLGTSEAVYKYFLLGSHGSLSQILCMAMAVRLLHLAWSLPGLLVTMTGAYKPRDPEAASVPATPPA